MEALSVAEDILSTTVSSDIEGLQLRQRVALRRLALCRLFPQQIHGVPEPPHIVPSDQRSNAWFGESVLAAAQAAMEKEDFDQALRVLNTYTAWADEPSVQEHTILQQIALLRGRIDRYRGSFDTAREYFNGLIKHNPPRISTSKLTSDAFSHLIAMECELGYLVSAQSRIEQALQEDPKFTFCSNGRSRRFRLALAETHLMKVLLRGTANMRSMHKSLQDAAATYTDLSTELKYLTKPGKVARMNIFRVAIGIAIIQHINCLDENGSANNTTRLTVAAQAWREALTTAKECGWQTGFSEGMINYSLSDIARRLHDFQAYEGYRKEARMLISKRQFYFTGWGTCWVDIMDDLIELSGGSRLFQREWTI